MSAQRAIEMLLRTQEPNISQARMAELLDKAYQIGRIILIARESGASDIAFNGAKPLGKTTEKLFIEFTVERALQQAA